METACYSNTLEALFLDIYIDTVTCCIIIIIIIITDLYSAFRSEDTEALDAAQED